MPLQETTKRQLNTLKRHIISFTNGLAMPVGIITQKEMLLTLKKTKRNWKG